MIESGSTRLVALAFLVVAAFVVTACSSAWPTASFSASSVSGEAPLVTRFTDSSEGEPTSWTWDFGDGGISTEQHPSHRFTAAGTYSVTLAATNDSGSRSVTLTDLVMVQAVPP